MTDEFEELIRSAGRGLGAAGETPTYHGAWQRGQRRRLVKRASMTAAGACALVLAFSVSVGQFGEDRSVEVSEVATNAVEVAPTAPPPTTAPVLPGLLDDDVAPDLDISPAPASGATDPDESDVDESGVDETDVDESDADAGGDGEVSPEPAPTIVIPIPLERPSSVEVVEAPLSPPPAEPVATATATATPIATSTPLPGSIAASTAGPSTAFDTSDVDDDDVPGAENDGTEGDAGPEGAGDEGDPTKRTEGEGETSAAGGDATQGVPGTDTTSPDESTTTTPGRGTAPSPSPSEPALAPVRLIDAVILGTSTSAEAGNFACDTDFDGVADARCEVLASYPCSEVDQATEGYVASDTNDDGALDTCMPAVSTWCRISVDGGRQRVECLIRFGRG